MNIYSISLLLAWSSNLIIGFLVFFKNPKNRVNQSFFFLSVILTFWLLGCFGETVTSYKTTALFWDRVLYTGVCLYPLLYLNFLSNILQLKVRKSVIRSIAAVCFIFLLFNYIPFLRTYLISTVERRFPFRFIAVPNLFWFVLVGFVMTIGTYGVFLKFRVYKKASSEKRNQMKYLFIAYAILTTGGGMYFLLPLNINVPPIDSTMVVIFSIIMAVAILKYRLMDIRVVITRTGIFIAVYAAVLGIPFAAATWYQGLLIKLLGVNWWILPLGAMALLATASPFVYIFLVRKAEDILFKDQRHYQNTLRELSKTLIRIRSLDQLSRSIVLTIANTVKTSFAAIYLKEEETKSYRLKQSFPETAHSGLDEFISYDSEFVKALERHKRPFTSEEIGSEKSNSEVGLIVPCFMEDDLLGFMVLGVKIHNQVFTPDDILIFETFSYSASLAIENCIFWKEIEDRHRKARLQEMDTFSYSLAHEIDNPMTFVYNLARFLKSHFVKYITETKEREEVEEMCDIIKEGSQRVMSMVKAIRQFGQKTSGELEPLNLQETVEGFFKLYSPELKANFVLFSKELTPEPIYVKGVAAELQQVLIILAKNAIHAMQSSQDKQLTLKLSRVNHNTARVEVLDTGYGIRKESLHTIFEPFFTTKASSEGTGMGLHNAKGFIIRHKGRIWAESEGKDMGATFIFELPIIEWQPPQKQEEKGKTEWAY